jgi:hypothetical protein
MILFGPYYDTSDKTWASPPKNFVSSGDHDLCETSVRDRDRWMKQGGWRGFTMAHVLPMTAVSN